jgi:hypothetical protein
MDAKTLQMMSCVLMHSLSCEHCNRWILRESRRINANTTREAYN